VVNRTKRIGGVTTTPACRLTFEVGHLYEIGDV
jgi:hypothetical protein